MNAYLDDQQKVWVGCEGIAQDEGWDQLVYSQPGDEERDPADGGIGLQIACHQLVGAPAKVVVAADGHNSVQNQHRWEAQVEDRVKILKRGSMSINWFPIQNAVLFIGNSFKHSILGQAIDVVPDAYVLTYALPDCDCCGRAGFEEQGSEVEWHDCSSSMGGLPWASSCCSWALGGWNDRRQREQICLLLGRSPAAGHHVRQGAVTHTHTHLRGYIVASWLKSGTHPSYVWKNCMQEPPSWWPQMMPGLSTSLVLERPCPWDVAVWNFWLRYSGVSTSGSWGVAKWEAKQTCTGILVRSASMPTTRIMVTVTRTVDRQPMRFSQDSFLKLGMKIMGTEHTMLTDTAKWNGLMPLMPAWHLRLNLCTAPSCGRHSW